MTDRAGRNDQPAASGRWLALALLPLLSACMQFAPDQQMRHFSLEQQPQRLQPDMLLMPIDVQVNELGMAGAEEVPQWTEQARQNLRTALEAIAASRDDVRIHALPPLTADEQQRVDEHRALFDAVAGNGFWATQNGGEAWRHKVTHFDYSIGPGLAFLAEKTGRPLALFVTAEDSVSSSGRKAAGALLFALTGSVVTGGVSMVMLGVVDLRSGDLLWVDYLANAGGQDLRKPEDAQQMLSHLFGKNSRAARAPRKPTGGSAPTSDLY